MTAPETTTSSGGRPALRVLRDRVDVDLPAAERAVTDLLRALGKDPADDHLAGTPRRVADAYAELLTPRQFGAISSNGRGALTLSSQISAPRQLMPDAE